MKTRPDILWVPKHYPGGNHALEATETHRVSYADAPSGAQEWLGHFDALFRMAHPPPALMLSHAQYPAQMLGLRADAEFRSELLGRTFKFNETPASLNPLVLQDLRSVRNYQGITVGDWYDMGAVREFASTIELPLSSADQKNGSIQQSLVAFILGVEAGIDIMPGLPDTSAAFYRALKALPQATRIEQRLTASLKQTASRLRNLGLAAPADSEVDALPFEAKVRLKLGKPGNAAAYDDWVRFVVQDADIWNRQGIMTLFQRAKIVEALSKKRFAAPGTIADEPSWVKSIMTDPTFIEFNRAIPWGDPRLRALFAEVSGTAERALQSLPATGVR